MGINCNIYCAGFVCAVICYYSFGEVSSSAYCYYCHGCCGVYWSAYYVCNIYSFVGVGCAVFSKFRCYCLMRWPGRGVEGVAECSDMINSSPPNLPLISTFLSELFIILARHFNASSPAGWPNTSLIFLKLSISII